MAISWVGVIGASKRMSLRMLLGCLLDVFGSSNLLSFGWAGMKWIYPVISLGNDRIWMHVDVFAFEWIIFWPISVSGYDLLIPLCVYSDEL